MLLLCSDQPTGSQSWDMPLQESQDGMITALRDEVATAEQRLDEERSSHADARRRLAQP